MTDQKAQLLSQTVEETCDELTVRVLGLIEHNQIFFMWQLVQCRLHTLKDTDGKPLKKDDIRSIVDAAARHGLEFDQVFIADLNKIMEKMANRISHLEMKASLTSRPALNAG